MKSLSEILGGSAEEEKTVTSEAQPSAANQASAKSKIKKEKKKVLPKAHTHGTKIEFDDVKDFSDSDDSLLGEEVVLLDMDVTDESKIFEDQKAPTSTIKQSRSSKPAAFGNRPQGLTRKKRKKRIKIETR